MWDDRVQPDAVTVTHEFLALLLGVRRQGVTIALHELEGKGLIRSTRSQVRILDREGLDWPPTASTAFLKPNMLGRWAPGGNATPTRSPRSYQPTPKFYRTF